MITKGGGVYVLMDSASGGFYIGSTANFRRRWHWHRELLRKGAHREALQRAWDANPDGFRLIPVCIAPPGEAVEIERRLLARLHGDAHCFNASPHASIPSETTRRKMAAAVRATQPAEIREKIGRALRGRAFSDETRAQMRASAKKRWADRGGPFAGREHTPESKAKLRAAALGRPGAFKGMKHTPETREKLRVARLAYLERRKIAQGGG